MKYRRRIYYSAAQRAEIWDRWQRRVCCGDRLNRQHKPDLQHPLELGPIMVTLPTFGAECRLIGAFQTWPRGVPKVAV